MIIIKESFYRSERYIKIYTAAILNSGIEHFDPPLTDEEKKQYEDNRKWIEEMRENPPTDKPIIFDMPFDD